MPARKKWTAHELLILLNMYHKMRFGQMHERNPAIVTLAKKLERTPGSVAMKLCNLASLDPALKLRGIKGLTGASKLDELMWEDFHAQLDVFVPASEEALRDLLKVRDDAEVEIEPKKGIHIVKAPPNGPTEVTANVQVRRGQEYFRNAVLNNFGGRCGITRLGVRELLIASHIMPWGTHTGDRLNVRNGLCLSRLHDAAFDRGLITFDDELRLVLSKRLKAELPQVCIEDNFMKHEGETLLLPEDAVLPDAVFLASHRTSIFVAS
ncbi:MAG: HNH endonuclease [Verrucomicrobiaceae bacterium]|nr:HNH endonuclease [Verrucomicrobiaceae bacterium]